MDNNTKLVDVFGANVIATTTDLDGNITYVSEAFSKVTGYSQKDLLHKNHSILRHPDMPNSVFKDLWETIKKGDTWENEIISLKKDGGFYWVLATISPNYDEDKNIIGYTSIRKDISDQKNIEQEIQKMIISIITNKEEFIDLKRDFEIFLDKLPDILTKSEKIEENITTLEEEFYKFKKSFSKQDIIHLSNAISNAEKELKKYLKKDDIDIFFIGTLLQSNLKIALSCDLKIIADIFGEGFLNSSASVSVNVDKIEDIKSQMLSLLEKSIDVNKDIAYDLLNTISSMLDQPFIDMLTFYSNMVKTISLSSNKQINPLVIKGDKKLFVCSSYKAFTDSLVHIFINSIEHGIESANTREESKKEKEATITCEYEKINENIVLKISDDGKGIDLEKVLQDSIVNGNINNDGESSITDEVILNSIFDEKPSHKKKGLEVVFYELNKINGTVEIENKAGQGVTFIFTIPYTKTKAQEVLAENIVLDCIIKASVNFLETNMDIEVKDIIDCKDYELGKYFSTVGFNGSVNLFCTIAMSEELTKSIYNVFVSDPMSEEDTREMMNSLPNEIVNIVSGLAISKFPPIYNDLVMSEPISFDKSILKNLKIENKNVSKKIKTVKGDFICTTIKLKD